MVPRMGLFSKKNIDKAKQLAEKNAAKIASGVDKATDAVDKKTGGKYTDKLKKVDDAAKKFAKEPTGAADAATTDTPTTDAAATDTATTDATAEAQDDTTGSGTSTG